MAKKKKPVETQPALPQAMALPVSVYSVTCPTCQETQLYFGVASGELQPLAAPTRQVSTLMQDEYTLTSEAVLSPTTIRLTGTFEPGALAGKRATVYNAEWEEVVRSRVLKNDAETATFALGICRHLKPGYSLEIPGIISRLTPQELRTKLREKHWSKSELVCSCCQTVFGITVGG